MERYLGAIASNTCVTCFLLVVLIVTQMVSCARMGRIERAIQATTSPIE